MPVGRLWQLERAVRMLQRKVLQLDEEVSGDFDHLLDTEEELNQDAPPAAAAAAAAQASRVPVKKKEVRYYYVMRGPYDKESKTFFSGYVKTAEEYALKQAGTWKFIGNLSSNPEKLTKWIIDHQDEINEETASWFSETGEFSKRWYSLIHPDGTFWVVAMPEDIAKIKAGRPELRTVQSKVHSSFKDGMAFGMTYAEQYCPITEAFGLIDKQLDNSFVTA